MAGFLPIKSPRHRPVLRCAGAIYLTLAAGVALVALLGMAGWVTFGTVLLLPVFVVAGVDAVRTGTDLWQDWRATQLGADVTRALATLGPSYRVLTRGAPASTRDSHVAIGPNGIFLILASDDGGRVTASDQRLLVNSRLPWRNLVEDCRVEALRVADRLQRALTRPVPVHAVLCFTRAMLVVGQEIRGVKIVQVPRLAHLIESAAIPAVLSNSDIAAARAALVTHATVTPLHPVFRLSRRRSVALGERPLTLVARPPMPQQSRS